jgi:hypothetical protein
MPFIEANRAHSRQESLGTRSPSPASATVDDVHNQDDFEREHRQLLVDELGDEWALLPGGATKRFRDLTEEDAPLPSPRLDMYRAVRDDPEEP